VPPFEEYRCRLQANEQHIERCDRIANRIGNARLLLGIASAIAYGMSLATSTFSILWLCLPLCVFIYLVIYHGRIRRARARAQRVAAFYKHGLARIEDRWMGIGERGEVYADVHHVYSADLDLFGNGSLFQLLCIARTRMGEDMLAKWLLAPATIAAVQARQTAVSELRQQLDLREQLAILGEQTTAGVCPNALLAWVSAQNRLQQSWIKWVARALALAAVTAAIGWQVTGLASPFLLTLLAEAGVTYVVKKQLKETLNAAEQTFQDLRLLAGFLARLEQEQFQAPLLLKLSEALRAHSTPASVAIDNLRSIVQLIESRRNIFMAVLDIPLMITVQAAFAAETWRRTHRDAVKSWLEVVGEFEALLSLSAYSFEHPADPFPEFIDGGAKLHAKGIAHPLIAKEKAIDNDVSLDSTTNLWLISGSNMSGKSTLLRAVGINAVLAMAGAPVRVRRLQMTALQVGASIRINDSLQEGSSRFYSEITRLQQLFSLSSTPPLLALLDELLQGTNSADRRIAAQGIVRALIARGAIGLMSTHDLALTDIVEANGSRITNVHFQDELQNGKMTFDFKLRAGVVTKSNALELMRSIGLVV
jgi:hypothetical protein